ncbi:hypothetical protein EV182_007720, partial [Spiromyces aspiralis]
MLPCYWDLHSYTKRLVFAVDSQQGTPVSCRTRVMLELGDDRTLRITQALPRMLCVGLAAGSNAAGHGAPKIVFERVAIPGLESTSPPPHLPAILPISEDTVLLSYNLSSLCRANLELNFLSFRDMAGFIEIIA